MSYKFSIRLEAAKVPELLGLWLSEALPLDFTVKQCRRLRMRVVEVTIHGSTADEIRGKCKAFFKVVRSAGFRGVVMRDKHPQQI